MDSEAVEVGALNNNKAFVDIDANANIVLPKTTDFNDAASEITYDDVSENVVGTLAYTYAGRQVGKADIVDKPVRLMDGYIFNNQSEVEQEIRHRGGDGLHGADQTAHNFAYRSRNPACSRVDLCRKEVLR